MSANSIEFCLFVFFFFLGKIKSWALREFMSTAKIMTLILLLAHDKQKNHHEQPEMWKYLKINSTERKPIDEMRKSVYENVSN